MPTALPPLIHALLNQTACYDHPVLKLACVETHISWVILTGDYAYKIKKPLNFGFLDFSSLALRQQDCAEELRLNRRLAADVYLAVVAITGTPDAPQVGGTGTVLEYTVKMRQFAPDATLDTLATRGELTVAQIDALAGRVAQFHLFDCAMAQADRPWGSPEAIAKPVAENFQILTAQLSDPALHHALADLKAWSEQTWQRLTPLFLERRVAGWVRECHGDLHLANVAWVEGRPLIFDCLEFSPALRWVDVMSEIAFCYMDLQHRGLADLAARFLNAWLEKTGDYVGVALLRYYAVYRALVRAKVAALRLEQVADPLARSAVHAEIDNYVQLAQRLSTTSRPELWITHGVSGSGKSTAALKLLQQRGLIRLRADVERKRLAGLDALARSPADGRLYTREFTQRTYQRLAELAASLLQAGWSVVVDAACLQRAERDTFRAVAHQHDADFHLLHLECDPATLRARVAQRSAHGQDASEADVAVLDAQLTRPHGLDADEIADCHHA